MAKPTLDQYSPYYLAVLMFKYNFDMLTRKEKKILSAWRKLPGHEEFFQDTINAEKERLREAYEPKIHVLDHAQAMFVHLPESSKN